LLTRCRAYTLRRCATLGPLASLGPSVQAAASDYSDTSPNCSAGTGTGPRGYQQTGRKGKPPPFWRQC